ncbi:MAG: glycoside hydrolase family 15 protein [Myxococcales bacterium]|nr:glycoside hydrolase family 15 protein [Myxococcales bacterium]
MDLYSAAKRLTRPFTFVGDKDGSALPIGSRGVIGDGFTAALVRADGAIDWLCLPRFDSPSVFAEILDAEHGGHTAITPSVHPFQSLQRYDPDTNVLETLFRVEDHGVVRMTDFMPWTGDPRLSVHEIHRRIRCVEGEVELDVTFDPRFDYGSVRPQIEHEEHGVLARSPSGDTFAAVLSGKHTWEERPEGGTRSTVRVRAGETRWMVLSWGAPQTESIAAYRPFEMLRLTRHRWREWASGLRYDGPWRHNVLRSALVLKLLTYAPTGAMVAAPTTSLPEWIGGVRNWDYRYTWTRDTAMAVRAVSRLGFDDVAREFFHFVRDTLERDARLQIMYTVDGSRVPDEQVLSRLLGFRGSSPVRVGNGARDQLQLDTAGALLDAAYMHENVGGTLSLRAWRRLRGVVETVMERWSEPDHGIWEPRDGVRHNTHSRLMSWVALRRGAELAPLFGDHPLAERFASAAEEVRQDIEDNALDASGDHFVAAYGEDRADATLLLLPVHGAFEPQNPRMRRTIDWVRDELGDGPFLRRYLSDDGVGGNEGAFMLCGFWLAEALALAGRVDEAHEVFVAHAEASNHLGLLSEEIDPSTGELLGNFPQAFSHIGLINAAARIDLALRLRDEGSQAIPDKPLRHWWR